MAVIANGSVKKKEISVHIPVIFFRMPPPLLQTGVIMFREGKPSS